MQEVEAKADEAIRSLVAEHAEVLRKVRIWEIVPSMRSRDDRG